MTGTPRRPTVRVGPGTRRALVATLDGWAQAGHDPGPVTVALLTAAAEAVDLALAQTRKGIGSPRVVSLAAATLDQLVRSAAPAGGADAEFAALLDGLLRDEQGRTSSS